MFYLFHITSNKRIFKKGKQLFLLSNQAHPSLLFKAGKLKFQKLKQKHLWLNMLRLKKLVLYKPLRLLMLLKINKLLQKTPMQVKIKRKRAESLKI